MPDALERMRARVAARPYRPLTPLSGAEVRPAAVLLPLLAAPEGARVLFTVRSSAMRSHAGQIAFPGGRVDAGETPEQAALRETEEEIGLRPQPAAVWGRLDDQLSPARFVVTPVVAALPWPQALVVNPGEVDEVFTAPLAELRALTPRSEARELYGLSRRIYYYEWRGRLIWGMTANILKNFLDTAFAPNTDGS